MGIYVLLIPSHIVRQLAVRFTRFPSAQRHPPALTIDASNGRSRTSNRSGAGVIITQGRRNNCFDDCMHVFIALARVLDIRTLLYGQKTVLWGLESEIRSFMSPAGAGKQNPVNRAPRRGWKKKPAKTTQIGAMMEILPAKCAQNPGGPVRAKVALRVRSLSSLPPYNRGS